MAIHRSHRAKTNKPTAANPSAGKTAINAINAEAPGPPAISFCGAATAQCPSNNMSANVKARRGPASNSVAIRQNLSEAYPTAARHKKARRSSMGVDH